MEQKLVDLQRIILGVVLVSDELGLVVAYFQHRIDGEAGLQFILLSSDDDVQPLQVGVRSAFGDQARGCCLKNALQSRRVRAEEEVTPQTLWGLSVV